MSFILSSGVIVPPMTAGGVAYGTGSQAKVSAVLTANYLVKGGGAGGPPSTVTTGTGVLTALGINVGNVGAFIVNGGTSVVNATGDGVTTIFYVNLAFIAIYISGVYQNRNTYTLTSNAVIFSGAPPNTSVIEFVYS